ncbi:MAG: WecB/TagA/CpsF family glycosyltransferase [Xanthomonadales bacterium]|nr:WecB/TagA/CpsF family glycosyltransferase [Xanthomonadales bacterium]
MNEDVLGYRVFSGGKSASVSRMMDAIRHDGRIWAACMNPHSYVVACDRKEFSRALKAADILVPDGIGIVLASRFCGGDIRERVTGFDLFTGLHDALALRGGGRVFFLGSTPEVLAEIAVRMQRDWPSLEVVGTYSPPFATQFSDAENMAMTAAVNAARADVLWVGMTAPKQEQWLHAQWPQLEVRVAGAIGAVFDFYAGRIKRSHPLFQRLGLEWLPRLLQEPRRLWRRTFVSTPRFLWDVWRFGIRKRQPPP